MTITEGEIIPVRENESRVRFGVAILCNDDVVLLPVREIIDTYDPATAESVMHGATVLTDGGDMLELLGPWQDPGGDA